MLLWGRCYAGRRDESGGLGLLRGSLLHGSSPPVLSSQGLLQMAAHMLPRGSIAADS